MSLDLTSIPSQEEKNANSCLTWELFRIVLRKTVLKDIQEKTGLKNCNLTKTKLSRGCLAGNFPDFLRTAFLIKTSRLLGFLMFSGGIERNQWH